MLLQAYIATALRCTGLVDDVIFQLIYCAASLTTWLGSSLPHQAASQYLHCRRKRCEQSNSAEPARLQLQHRKPILLACQVTYCSAVNAASVSQPCFADSLSRPAGRC